MKTIRLLFPLLLAVRLFGQYQYFLRDTFNSTTDPNWVPNATYRFVNNGTSYVGLTRDPSLQPSDSPLIYAGQVPANDRYEIRTVLPSPNTYPAIYSHYAAINTINGLLSYYEVEYQPYGGSPCAATVTIYRVDVVSNGAGGWQQNYTNMGSSQAACPDNTVIRTLFSGNSQISLTVFVNNVLMIRVTDTAQPLSGQPGVGLNTSTSPTGVITEADLGPWDTVPPNPVDPSTIGVTTYPTQIDFQWQPTTDDPNGSGIYGYAVFRNGNPLTWYQPGTVYSDQAVSTGQTYTYSIEAIDFHQNVSSQTSFTATATAPHVNLTIATPPARIGVRPTGAYWGAGGEQIDVGSGNLNWTLPLLKVQSRGGLGVGISLNYNSQIWRQNTDSNGTSEWNLGLDVGYGFGWTLLAGSIAAYWSDPYTIDHYIFTDSTGAEYRLGVNTNGIWTSQEAIYLSFDPGSLKLSFPDGSFWVMTCESGGNEPDLGTLYPNVMQDTNGNQIMIRYQTGQSATAPNSSARISEIEDVRATYNYPGYRTYYFTYNSDSTPHLTNINNAIGTGESYTFSYANNQTISSPFPPQYSYPNVTLLQSVTNNSINQTNSFEYVGGSGELTRVILPYGGYIRWGYGPFTFFNGAMTIREVQYRYLSKSGSGETVYALTRDPSDYSRDWHSIATLTDPTGAIKQWGFMSNAGAFWNGLETSFLQAAGAGQAPLRQLTFSWNQDSAGNPYIGSAATTLDVGTSYQQVSTTNQTLDAHGNVLQTQIYDFGNSSTPARTYTNTYLTDSNYTSRGIWNRLLTSQVSNGSQTVTLIGNQYDTANYPCGQGGFVGLSPVTGARQHDDANYGTNFYYRGNPTYHADAATSACNSFYVTGAISRSVGTNGTIVSSTTTATNYAAPSAITANNVTNTLTYTGFLGLTSSTGQNSDTMSIGYDAAARPSTVTSPTGATTGYSYVTNPPMTTATTGTHWVESDLDGLGRPIRVKTGDSSGVKSWADTEYDSCACSPLGKMKRTSQPYPPNGTPSAWTTYTYDALGRTVSVVAPDGASATTYVYQGNTTTVIDPAGKWKKYVTDAMNHLIQVIEPNPGNN